MLATLLASIVTGQSWENDSMHMNGPGKLLLHFPALLQCMPKCMAGMIYDMLHSIYVRLLEALLLHFAHKNDIELNRLY